MKVRQIQATIRTDCVPALVRSLKEQGISRLLMWHAHALGSGVDPEHFRVSMEEGTAYSDTVVMTFFCEAARIDEVIRLVLSCASTGHHGDGLVVVSSVERVVSVRTGDEDALAVI